MLKCELSSAREEYKFCWFTYGEDFDHSSMEATHGVGSGVLTTVFPGLVVSTADTSRVIGKARVRLMPKGLSNAVDIEDS